jgi:hypothetical protein
VAESVIGWRFEMLTRRAMNRADRRRALSYVPFGHFSRNGVRGPASCAPEHFVDAGIGLPWSPYTRQSHESPHPECQCGFRVVEDLDELQDYLDLTDRVHPDRARTPGVLGALAVYRAEGFGRVLPGPAPMSDDPPTTSRASSLRLLGPVYLPDDRTGRAADRHLDRLRSRPEVWYVDDPRDLWSADLEHHLTGMATPTRPG